MGGLDESGADYEPIETSVVIPADRQTQTIVVQPIDDNEVEVVEVVKLSLVPDETYEVGLLNLAVISLLDNDIPLLGK